MTDPFFNPDSYGTITAFARNMTTAELIDRAKDKYWLASLDKNDLRELVSELADRMEGQEEYISRIHDRPDEYPFDD